MPHFFFDLNDGDVSHYDHIGSDLADEKAARDEALKYMGEVAARYLHRGSEPPRVLTVQVRDSEDIQILQLGLSLTIKQMS